MTIYPSTMLKPCLLILTLLSVSFTTQARDSLGTLRKDLNTALTKLQDQQAQITALQARIDSLKPDGYAVGGTGPAGGIVFYITDAGAHGLEAAPEDQGVAQWGCAGQILAGADGTAIGIGGQNTQDILAGCNATGIAAQLAAEYVWPNGQTDGYLPSKDELNALYRQRTVVGGFAGDFYWSASEFGSNLAWYQSFVSGNQSYGSTFSNSTKNSARRVRAVRAF